MAKNYVREGNVVPVTLTAAANTGDLVVVGNLFGVAQVSGGINDTVSIVTGEVWALPKAAGASTLIAVGGNVYWDATNAKVTNSATSNLRIGVCVTAAANADTVVTTRLNGSF